VREDVNRSQHTSVPDAQAHTATSSVENRPNGDVPPKNPGRADDQSATMQP